MTQIPLKVQYNEHVFNIFLDKQDEQKLKQLSLVNNNKQELSEQFLKFYDIQAICQFTSQITKSKVYENINILDLCILCDYQHVSDQIMQKFSQVATFHPNVTYLLLFMRKNLQLIQIYSVICPYTTNQLFQAIQYFPEAEALIDEIHKRYQEEFRKRLRERMDEQSFAARLHPALQLVPPPRDDLYNTPLIVAAATGATNLIAKFISYANCSNYEFKSACHYIDVKNISAFNLLDVETHEKSITRGKINQFTQQIINQGIKLKNKIIQNANPDEQTESQNPYQNMYQELMSQGYFDELIHLKDNTINNYKDDIQINILKNISKYDEQFKIIIDSFRQCKQQKQHGKRSLQTQTSDLLNDERHNFQYYNIPDEEVQYANGSTIDKQRFKNWIKTDIYAYQENEIYISPLMYAVIKNDEELVKFLLDDFQGSQCPLTGITALLIALRCGHWDIAEKYLLHEKDIFTRLKVTPFIGSIAGGSYEFARKHFNDQCDLHDANGMFPLCQAVISYNTTAFNNLLYQSKKEYTSQRYSIQLSAQNGQDYYVFKLLEEQVNVLDVSNCTALHYAVQKYEDQQNYINVIKMLLPFNAQRCDKNGYTALTHAVQRKRSPRLIELLASYEAGLNYRSYMNQALLSAVLCGQCEVVKIIYPLEKRIYRDKSELLTIALEHNFQDIVEYLVNEEHQLYQIFSDNQNILQKLVKLDMIPEIIQDKIFHPNYIIQAYIEAQKQNRLKIASQLIQMLKKSLNSEGRGMLLLSRVDRYDE